MQISVGDEGGGVTSWTNSTGGAWLCWRFSFPRQVQRLLVTLPVDELGFLELKLAHLDRELDAFVAMELVEECTPFGWLYLAKVSIVSELLVSLW